MVCGFIPVYRPLGYPFLLSDLLPQLASPGVVDIGIQQWGNDRIPVQRFIIPPLSYFFAFHSQMASFLCYEAILMPGPVTSQNKKGG